MIVFAERPINAFTAGAARQLEGSDAACACGCGQLLPAKVRAIRYLRAEGFSFAEIGRQIGVDARYARQTIFGSKTQAAPRYLKGHYRLSPDQRATAQAGMDRERAYRERHVARYRAEKEQRDRERALTQGWRRLAHAVAVAARLTLRWADAGWRRLAHAVAVAARLTLRAFAREHRERIAVEHRDARERTKAAKRARWWSERPERKLPESLDALSSFEDGNGTDLYDYARTRASIADDPANLLLQSEAEDALRRIVGDMAPEDVQRMTAWNLERLRDRLADAGLVPLGVQEAERERLRDPQRHAGELVKQAKGGGGKRSRKAQQQVTRDHHVREMTGGQKNAHKQRRKARRERVEW